MKKEKILRKTKSLKNISLSLVIGFSLVAGITFAWNAVWHGTDWIDTGKVIPAKEIAENFEYLYNILPTSEKCTPGSVLSWGENQINCLKCEDGESIIWNNGEPTCGSSPCKIQVCFDSARCASLDNDGFWWDDDWSPTVSLTTLSTGASCSNLKEFKICFFNPISGKKCTSLNDSGFYWNDDWSPQVTIEGENPSSYLCENNKEFNICFYNQVVGKRCASFASGFSWDDDWSPKVTLECK